VRLKGLLVKPFDEALYFEDCRSPAARVALVLAHLPFAILAVWMHYIVSSFLFVDGWISGCVNVVLRQLVYSIYVWCGLIAIWALFRPRWIRWIVVPFLAYVVIFVGIVVVAFVGIFIAVCFISLFI
jgi:hypothetical protein